MTNLNKAVSSLILLALLSSCGAGENHVTKSKTMSLHNFGSSFSGTVSTKIGLIKYRVIQHNGILAYTATFPNDFTFSTSAHEFAASGYRLTAGGIYSPEPKTIDGPTSRLLTNKEALLTAGRISLSEADYAVLAEALKE